MIKELSDLSSSVYYLGCGQKETCQEKAKICFGSGLERKTLGSDTKGMVSKHARYYMKENLAIAPGMYEISSQRCAVGALMNKPTSNLGTVLGGRKAKRQVDDVMFTPGPGKYDIPTFPTTIRQTRIPFDSKTERGREKIPDVPGVGTYNVAPHKHRPIVFGHSFGGKKCLLPAVKMKCGPFNFDTCEFCQQPPGGDYWSLDAVEVNKKTQIKKSKGAKSDGVFLCRECYETEKKENKIFTKGQMKKFKKLRDCSKVHFHDGCKGKLFIVSPQDIAKLKEREAYLSLYFN